MDQRTEPIRQDIDQLRDSMTEKMQQIESKVKDTVDGTVSQVKQAFDIKQQVRDHTWASLGIAVLAGYVVGSLGGESKPNYSTKRYSAADYNTRPEQTSNGGYSVNSYSTPGYQSSPAYQSSSYQPQQKQQGGFMDDLLGQFGDELDTIKTAAVSSLVALLRDTIKENVPQFGQEYERVRQEHEVQQENGTLGSSSTSSTSPTSPTSTLREQSVGTEIPSSARTYNP